MSHHPDLLDIINAKPRKVADINAAIEGAYTRGILAANLRKKQPPTKTVLGLPHVAGSLVRGVLLTNLLLLHFDALLTNDVTLEGTTKKTAKQLVLEIRQLHNALRHRASKTIKFTSNDGLPPAESLRLYLEQMGDLLWELVDEATKADDIRLLVALVMSYNEGLVRDSTTGKVFSKANEPAPGDGD